MLQAKLFKDDNSGGGGTKVPVGIHEGADFLGITTESTWSDINYGLDGRSIHKRLFVPTGAQPLEGETIQQALDREISRNLGHVVQAMTAVLGKEIVDTFEASDYKGFLAAAAAVLNPKKGSKVNLKVIPDRKEQKYPDLPAYGTYVEQHVEGVPTKLKYSKKESEAIEVMEKNRNASGMSGSAMSAADVENLV